ncbi:MAG: hypothetical protein KDD60_09190, partial [Bdellovibrionales bacterium]|nr:hypothetical protein [Bdellovibrionales bacterium]
MIHIFNSSQVSGPERLVLPVLPSFPNARVVLLFETRRALESIRVVDYLRSLCVPFFLIPVRSRYDLKAVLHLGRYILSERDEVFHAHDVKASCYLILAAVFGRYRNTLVSTHHGVFGR